MGLCEGAWGGGEEVWACSWLAVNERGFDVQSQHSSTVLQISAEFQGQSLRGIPKIILVAFFFSLPVCEIHSPNKGTSFQILSGSGIKGQARDNESHPQISTSQFTVKLVYLQLQTD